LRSVEPMTPDTTHSERPPDAGSLLRDLIVATFDSVGSESKLGFKPAPPAERAGHTGWRPPLGIFNMLLAPVNQ
jgi:hypothetical protein